MEKKTRGIFFTLLGALMGVAATLKAVGKIILKKQNMSDKHLALYLMMNQWVKVKQEGKSLKTYFEKYGYKKIAIYGMSYAGETLCRELKDSDVEIAYGIDQNAEWMSRDIEMKRPQDDLTDVDAIIVTVVYYFDEIEKNLKQKVNCPILSLGDIVYEV